MELYSIKAKLFFTFLLAVLMIIIGGMVSIFFFSQVLTSTEGFVNTTLPKISRANELDITARDIRVGTQKLIHAGSRDELYSSFTRVDELLDRLEMLTAKVSQEGGEANILVFNRTSQTIRSQSLLVFQMATHQISLQQEIKTLANETRGVLTSLSLGLLKMDPERGSISKGYYRTYNGLQRQAMDVLSLLDECSEIDTREEVEELARLFAEKAEQLRFLSLQLGELTGRTMSNQVLESGLERMEKTFPLRRQQLMLEKTINNSLQGLELSSHELSQVSSDHARQVFAIFQNNAGKVIENEKRTVSLIVTAMIVSSGGLFFLFWLVVIRGFASRLSIISKAMVKGPEDDNLSIQVPVRGRDEIARMARSLEQFLEIALKLKRMATVDELTMISNRRHFFDLAKREVALARRNGSQSTLLMLDVDHFKSINDTHGHDIGDMVLQKLAYFCQELVRAEDVFARLGGEEFVVLMPNSDEAEGLDVAERLRRRVEELKLVVTESLSLTITVSIGVASVTFREHSLREVLKHADQAMYQAKNRGRNCVVSWSELPE